MKKRLIVKDITKAFGNLVAVNNVCFDVGEGEIFGIAGPNGSGKTTLFNVISSLSYHADSGQIIFENKQIHYESAHVICHMGIARTFQQETIFDSMTILENVMVGAIYGNQHMDRHSIHNETIESLKFVGLYARRNEEAENLSLFEKKLLMLASALATKPKLLLLDEPAAGLNRPETEESAEMFKRIIKTFGVSIILVEHKLPLLLKVSDRIMVLNFGKKLIEGQPKMVMSDNRVIEAYLGKKGSYFE